MFLELVNEIALPILTVISIIFSILFAYRKIGQEVFVNYSVVGEGFSSTRISNIVLQNEKDKPVCIYTIYAVFPNKQWLILDKYNPPKVLKPLEAIGLRTPEYSYLTPKINLSSHIMDVDIYLKTISGLLIKCTRVKGLKHLVNKITLKNKKDNLKRDLEISKYTKSFNGFVYSDSVVYILVYSYNKKSYTAFVAKSGVIDNEWNFPYNFIQSQNNQINQNDVKNFLNTSPMKEIISNYYCYEVDPYLETKLIFWMKLNKEKTEKGIKQAVEALRKQQK